MPPILRSPPALFLHGSQSHIGYDDATRLLRTRASTLLGEHRCGVENNSPSAQDDECGSLLLLLASTTLADAQVLRTWRGRKKKNAAPPGEGEGPCGGAHTHTCVRVRRGCKSHERVKDGILETEKQERARGGALYGKGGKEMSGCCRRG